MYRLLTKAKFQDKLTIAKREVLENNKKVKIII